MLHERYERLAQMDWWQQHKVSGAHAIVGGAGALGNEVVKNLVLMGWGNVTIVDRDTIEPSNLTRSIFFREGDVGRPKAQVLEREAKLLNPHCTVRGLHGDIRVVLGTGMAHRSDIIFGCFDNVGGRLALNDLAGKADRLYLDGGLTTWEGTVTSFLASAGPCYSCGLTYEDFKDLNLRRSCPAYAKRAAAAAGIPTTAPLASVTAACMVQQALKWIHGLNTKPHLTLGTQIRFDLAFDRFWKYGLPMNPECLLHPQAQTAIRDTGLSSASSWREILNYWQEQLSSEVTIHLPVSIVESCTCSACNTTHNIHKASVEIAEYGCPVCGSPAIPTYVNQITKSQDWLELSPDRTNYPKLAWLSAVEGDQELIFELEEANRNS